MSKARDPILHFKLSSVVIHIAELNFKCPPEVYTYDTARIVRQDISYGIKLILSVFNTLNSSTYRAV
jgi:hypothetical protein